MADRTDWQHQPQSQTSSVIDLDDMELIENDASDYESDFRDSGKTEGEPYANDRDGSDDIRQRLNQNVTEMMWQVGKQHAKKAWTLYGNIDILRPYFDVQPHEVRSRLIQSLVPRKAISQRQSIPRELYGPMMVIFTLIALLLFQMKSSGHKVQEGTLMGTSFLVCFTYWFGASGTIFLLSYLCNIRITMIQVLSMLGYGLFGHCVVVFLGTITHTSHSHYLFYVLWAIFGGLSTARMALLILSRTSGQSQRVIVCSTIAFLHLIFLLYLHFAYHQTVEEISEVFNKDILPKPVEDVINHKLVRELGGRGNINQHLSKHGPNLAIDKIDTLLQNSIQGMSRKVIVGINTTMSMVKESGQSLLKAALNNMTKNKVVM